MINFAQIFRGFFEKRWMVGSAFVALIGIGSVESVWYWKLIQKPIQETTQNAMEEIKVDSALDTIEPESGGLGYINTEEKVKPGGMPERVFNILLLGHGDAGHAGGGLTDGMMIVRIDTEKKKVALVSIPRDVWVELPVSSNETRGYKINAAYVVGGDDRKFSGKADKFSGPLGSANMAKHAVEQVTGLPIDYFLAADFYDVIHVVDVMGGVEVNLETGFEDKYYPVKGRELETCGKSPEEVTQLSNSLSGFELEKQFECRYEILKFESGKNKLNGETALKFMRSRHSNTEGSDFSRARRQQLVILGIRDRLLKFESLEKAIPLFEKVAKSIRTDIDTKILKAMIDLSLDYKDYTFNRIVLSTENVLTTSKSNAGAFILIPKAGDNQWNEAKNFVSGQLNK